MKLISKVLLTSALALPSFVLAGTSGQTLQVHVPFSFMVGDKQFTAGDYRIQETDSGVIYVQGEGRGAAAITVPAGMNNSSVTSLRFSNADQHYLTGVQVQGAVSRTLVLPAEDQHKLTLSSNR